MPRLQASPENVKTAVCRLILSLIRGSLVVALLEQPAPLKPEDLAAQVVLECAPKLKKEVRESIDRDIDICLKELSKNFDPRDTPVHIDPMVIGERILDAQLKKSEPLRKALRGVCINIECHPDAALYAVNKAMKSAASLPPMQRTLAGMVFTCASKSMEKNPSCVVDAAAKFLNMQEHHDFETRGMLSGELFQRLKFRKVAMVQPPGAPP